MNYKIIQNDQENEALGEKILNFINSHVMNQLKDDEQNEFELMCLLQEHYESKRYPAPNLDPIEFIKFMMEQRGMKIKDIADCFGTASRAYEVLSHKRNLTLSMIRKLKITLGCSTDALIGA